MSLPLAKPKSENPAVMTSYFALAGKEVYSGGFAQCVAWARSRVEADSEAVVKILRARAGEPTARVVAEVTREGERIIARGRHLPVSNLKRRCPAA